MSVRLQTQPWGSSVEETRRHTRAGVKAGVNERFVSWDECRRGITLADTPTRQSNNDFAVHSALSTAAVLQPRTRNLGRDPIDERQRREQRSVEPPSPLISGGRGDRNASWNWAAWTRLSCPPTSSLRRWDVRAFALRVAPGDKGTLASPQARPHTHTSPPVQ